MYNTYYYYYYYYYYYEHRSGWGALTLGSDSRESGLPSGSTLCSQTLTNEPYFHYNTTKSRTYDTVVLVEPRNR